MGAENREKKGRPAPIAFSVLFAALMCSLVAPCAGAQTSAPHDNRKSITAVIHYDYPPITFVDPKTHKAAGFETAARDFRARPG